MKKSEANELAIMLAKLFPGSALNDEHAKSIREEFSKFEYEHVKAAIKEHHRTREFICFPELYKSCAEKPLPAASTTRQSIPDMEWADVHRQHNPQLRDIKNDVEVCLRVHRGWWKRGREQDCYRYGIRFSCVNVLCGMTLNGKQIAWAEAEAWAECVFGDVEYFKNCLAELRGEIPAFSGAP